MNMAIQTATIASNDSARMAAKREAETREKKERNKGKDELLIYSKLSAEEAGKELAESLEPDHEFNKETGMLQTKENHWDFVGVLPMIFITSIGLILIMVDLINWLQFFGGTLSGILLGIGLGYWMAGPETYDAIKITPFKEGSRILLTIYDSDGNRELHEDEIDDIIEIVNGTVR